MRDVMKTDIHPEFNVVTVTCACGASHLTRATKAYAVDICSQCHPFYTGKQKIMDTAGMVERFNNKYKNRRKPSAS